MAKYLLVESRDPFDWTAVEQQYELASGLAKEGNAVTFFLVQNGVLPARRGPKSEFLTRMVKAGVEVLADDFSLRERGIPPDRLVTGIKSAPIDIVIDQLAEGRKTIFH